MSETSVQPALITGIVPESIAAEIGFSPGDRLVKINGRCPRDLIDYQFLCSDEVLDLEVLDDRGKSHRVEIEKDYDEDLGLEFDTALFDGLIQCNNKCPFCFIDQQPPGKRASLYFKDDDYRLSFLYGSYLTLTNLTTKEWDRAGHSIAITQKSACGHDSRPIAVVPVPSTGNSRPGSIVSGN
jgi:putative radical SAM enzyme (TIGR03279 family)